MSEALLRWRPELLRRSAIALAAAAFFGAGIRVLGGYDGGYSNGGGWRELSPDDDFSISSNE